MTFALHEELGWAMAPAHILKPGVLYRGDNNRILADMPDESADLIYLDPPFFSNRAYEVIWGDEAEVRSFMDRWDGGIEKYVDWMEKRCRQLHRVLAPNGSFYLHCDWHAGHYLKVMLDDVFGGRKHFQNEIVWYYRGGGVSKYRWGRRHDVLLFYTKSAQKGEWTFNVDPVRMNIRRSRNNGCNTWRARSEATVYTTATDLTRSASIPTMCGRSSP